MSFSKGATKGKQTPKDAWDYIRGEHEICYCSYPSCRNRKITRDQDAVSWDIVHIAKDEFEFNLSPLAKLAVVANPKITDRGEEWGDYFVTLFMHAECAAEWGMHLIKDALQSHNVGTKLRKEKPQNAIREQTKTI
jgi:hypothetical protein